MVPSLPGYGTVVGAGFLDVERTPMLEKRSLICGPEIPLHNQGHPEELGGAFRVLSSAARADIGAGAPLSLLQQFVPRLKLCT